MSFLREGCWAEGESCACPGVSDSEMGVDSPYASGSLHHGVAEWLGGGGRGLAGFLRRPEIPESALGCIQPNHNHLSARHHGSPPVPAGSLSLGVCNNWELHSKVSLSG